MKLTDQQKSTFEQNLITKLESIECPLCKKKKSIELYETLGSFISTTGSTIKYVMGCCNNCGFLIQINPEKLGVVLESE